MAAMLQIRLRDESTWTLPVESTNLGLTAKMNGSDEWVFFHATDGSSFGVAKRDIHSIKIADA